MLPYRKPNRRPKIDYAGALLLALTTASIVLAADGAQLFGSLVAPQNLAMVALGVAAVIGWIFAERRAAEPIVPLSLFRNSTFSPLLVMSIMSGAIGIGMVNYFALFLQTTTGLSPSAAGAFFILLTGGIVCGSLSAGRIISINGRYKPFAIASLTCSAIAFVLLTQVHAGTPVLLIGAVMALHGFGVGLAQQVPVVGVQNAAPARDVGAATGSVTLSRMGGASIAISIYGAIVGSQLGKTGLSIPGVTDIDQLTPKMLAALPEVARQAVAEAYANAFYSAVHGFLRDRSYRPLRRLDAEADVVASRGRGAAGSQCRSSGVNAGGGPGPPLARDQAWRYTFKRSNGVPRAIRCAAERLKANPRNLIRLTPAEGLDA